MLVTDDHRAADNAAGIHFMDVKYAVALLVASPVYGNWLYTYAYLQWRRAKSLPARR